MVQLVLVDLWPLKTGYGNLWNLSMENGKWFAALSQGAPRWSFLVFSFKTHCPCVFFLSSFLPLCFLVASTTRLPATNLHDEIRLPTP